MVPMSDAFFIRGNSNKNEIKIKGGIRIFIKIVPPWDGGVGGSSFR